MSVCDMELKYALLYFCFTEASCPRQHILKDFNNATLASMYIFPEDQIFPIIDTKIDKSDYLACIRCQNQKYFMTLAMTSSKFKSDPKWKSHR